MNGPALIRSFLFVPAANEKLLASALGKSSDAVILDLEDGTHPLRRPDARTQMAASIQRVKAAGKCAAVRINSDWLDAVADLQACIQPGVDIIVLPKVEHPRDVQVLERMVAALEAAASWTGAQVRFLIQIESALALPLLYEIAASSPRNMGMMLGSEDFSLDCGSIPTPDSLLVPSLMVVHAARAAGIQPIGFIASIADLGDPQDFKAVLDRARGLGFRGAVVVHPKFVDMVNESYTASAEQLKSARRIVEMFEDAFAKGNGTIRVDGMMIDKPVYRRALALLSAVPAPCSDVP